MLKLSGALLLIGAAWAACWLMFAAGRDSFPFKPPPPRAKEVRAHAMLETIWITGKDGTPIEAWLVLPLNTPRPPVVVMAPGLAGTKEGPLERFAWAFAESGIAVLVFDFRTFGGSHGMPRHWIDPDRQIEDYEAAVAHIGASLSDRLDADRIALWGTSFSGGVALRAAAHLGARVKATVAQVPYIEPSPSQEPDASDMIRYIALVAGEQFGDSIAGALGARLDPVYIPVYGKPGEPVFAKSADHPSYLRPEGTSLHPFWFSLPKHFRGGWKNRMLVRALPGLDKHRPIDELTAIETPVMLIGARRDDMIPIASIERGAARLRSAASTFVACDCGHFDVYVDPFFTPNMSGQITFLRAAFAR